MPDIEGFSRFADWDPLEYIRGYYGQPVDSDPTLRFIVQQARRIPGRRPLAVEVGSGPVISNFAALAQHAAEIHVADYLPVNLDYIHSWLERRDPHFSWNFYLSLLLDYAGSPCPGEAGLESFKRLVREKVTQLLVCDVTQTDPLGPAARGKYDCVLSISCADSITQDKAQWRTYMFHIFSLLKPGGLFIGESLKESNSYQFGGSRFPVVSLSEADCVDVMLDYGFDPASLVTRTEDEGFELDAQGRRIAPLRPEYSQVILTSGYLKVDTAA